MPTALRRDVDDFAKPIAESWVGLTRRHPVGMPIADLLIYSAIITLAWIFVSSTAGIAALALTLALYGLGIFRVLRKRYDQAR